MDIAALKKDKSVEALKLLLEHFEDQYNVEPDQLLSILEEKPRDNKIPLVSFSNDRLSTLEIVVKYLKENQDRKYSEIAKLLNRDDRTIWSSYNNSLKKYKGPLLIKGQIFIPVSIFSNREKSTLENLVIYLKDELGFSYKEISTTLRKEYQTIYTTYRRGKAKDEK